MRGGLIRGMSPGKEWAKAFEEWKLYLKKSRKELFSFFELIMV